MKSTIEVEAARPLRGTLGFLIALWLIVLSLPAWAGQAAAQDRELTHIPVVLNLYPNAGLTEQEARDAIEEANRALRQAGARLVVVRVNNPPAGNGGDDGSGGGTAGDGDFTYGELDKVMDFGGREVAGIPGRKGLKISFARTPEAAVPANPAITIHRNPTIVVRKRGAARATGETIAHEVGHVLTLGVGHVIDGGAGTRADSWRARARGGREHEKRQPHGAEQPTHWYSSDS